jgi:hypothetical protein
MEIVAMTIVGQARTLIFGRMAGKPVDWVHRRMAVSVLLLGPNEFLCTTCAGNKNSNHQQKPRAHKHDPNHAYAKYTGQVIAFRRSGGHVK